VTLRLRPVAEEIGVVFVGIPTERFAEALDIIHRSQTRPAWILSDRIPAPAGWDHAEPELRFHWPTRIGFDGSREAIAWQIEQLKSELGNGWYSLMGEIGNIGWTALPEIPRRLGTKSVCRLRASIRPSHVARFCRIANSLAENITALAFSGTGVVLLGFDDDWPVTRVRDALNRLLGDIAPGEGNVVVEYCPPESKKSLPVWGRPPADLALQKAVKRALDPNNLFNPGRFVTDAF